MPVDQPDNKLNYEPRGKQPTAMDWLKEIWPWALMIAFGAFVFFMLLAHPGGE